MRGELNDSPPREEKERRQPGDEQPVRGYHAILGPDGRTRGARGEHSSNEIGVEDALQHWADLHLESRTRDGSVEWPVRVPVGLPRPPQLRLQATHALLLPECRFEDPPSSGEQIAHQLTSFDGTRVRIALGRAAPGLDQEVRFVARQPAAERCTCWPIPTDRTFTC